MKQWWGVSLSAEKSLERSLIELVKIRSSILNGCANCINIYTADARAHGETEQRTYLVAAWHEAPVYTPREWAALAWTDALTRPSTGAIKKEAREELAAHSHHAGRMNPTVMQLGKQVRREGEREL